VRLKINEPGDARTERLPQEFQGGIDLQRILSSLALTTVLGDLRPDLWGATRRPAFVSVDGLELVLRVAQASPGRYYMPLKRR